MHSRSATREAQPVTQPEPSPAVQATPVPVAAQQQRASCVIAGPVESGKTAFLSVIVDACTGSHPGDYILRATPEAELARLIAERDRGRTERAGLVATGHNREYHFLLSADRLRRFPRWSTEPLGKRRFTCIDGPGGALFSKDPTSLTDEMKGYRHALVTAGQTADTLVFFLSVMAEDVAAMVSTNLILLMADLAVELNIPLQPVGGQPGATGAPFSTWWQRPSTTPSVVPPAPNSMMEKKLNASRVLLVLNFVDQLCTGWQQIWHEERDPRSSLSSLKIAAEYARPQDIAEQVLGTMYLRQIEAFLRPGARLAVGLCSCGGFDMSSGDPCRDNKGIPNIPDNLPARLRDQQAFYYGVREVLLYAGYGIATKGIVEEVTAEYLYS